MSLICTVATGRWHTRHFVYVLPKYHPKMAKEEFMTFYCSCGEDFDEKPALEIHKKNCSILKEILENEKENQPETERKCETKKSEKNYVTNSEPSVAQEQFSCSFCSDKSYKKKKHLREHYRVKHPSYPIPSDLYMLKSNVLRWSQKESRSKKNLRDQDRKHPPGLQKSWKNVLSN